MVAKSSATRRWLAVVVAGTLAITAVNLGVWQLGRADEKQQLVDRRASRTTPMKMGESATAGAWQPTITAESLDQQHVVLRGQWLLDQSIALDNRAWDGRAGVHVLTPLQLGDQSIVWVNRGWMEKAPGLQTVAFPPAIPAVDLPGVALASVMRRMELSRNETTLRQGTVWQNFDWESAAQRVKGNVWPVIVWQTGENSDGLLRRLPELSSDVPKHLGYAAQWFLLASVALFFGWRLRPRPISE